MKPGRWWLALERALYLDGGLEAAKECTPQEEELLDMAEDVDRLERDLVRNVRTSAAAFSKYADDLEAGWRANPPTSIVLEFERDAVVLQTKIDALVAAIRLVKGSGIVKAFRDAETYERNARANRKAAAEAGGQSS